MCEEIVLLLSVRRFRVCVVFDGDKSSLNSTLCFISVGLIALSLATVNLNKAFFYSFQLI